MTTVVHSPITCRCENLNLEIYFWLAKSENVRWGDLKCCTTSLELLNND